jgi:succinylglutamate desuccinylase
VTAAPARVIAELRGIEPGATLIVIGGVHGNEPAGIAAARAVIGTIDRAAIRGELLALIGNVRAAAAGRRHLGHDLNRLWTEDHVAAARHLARAGEGGAPELHELVELAAAIDQAIGRARGPVYVLDLHTTSAPGFPFAVVGPTAEHRGFARAFELPGILGLEEALPGVLTGYYGRRGCITLAIEGGQHTASATADNLAAIVTLALEAAGLVPAMPGAAAARGHLARVRGELPPLIEVAVRHPVRPEHAFRMEPGFANLQRTPAGTLLARDRGGEIRAPFDGVVLLPLYQPDGDDGFFYGRALDA